jgi:hypothetical protein
MPRRRLNPLPISFARCRYGSCSLLDRDLFALLTDG